MTDIKFAIRAFSKTPGFTLVVLLTIALGVGATTAIFSVINAVLLKPLPYANADRLVIARVSMPDYKDLKTSVDAFEDSGVWGTNMYNLRLKDASEQIMGLVMSSHLLSMLGVEPLLGRNFTAEDALQNTAVLSYGLWQSRFGGDPSVLGRSIDLSGISYTVVGIAPAWFSFPTSQFKVWVPIDSIDRLAPAQANNRGLRIFNMVALLKPDVNVQAAQAQVAARSAALAKAYPATNENVTMRVVSLEERLLGDAKPGLNMLLVTVALLLLIACANVANLMLARTTGRGRELAIRAALGAGRGRLIRQVLTESLLLAIAGGLIGLLVAAWTVDALPSLLADRVPRADNIRVDGTVLLFAITATIGTALLFGFAPALHGSGGDSGPLKETGRTVTGSTRSRRLRHLIAVAEVALAVMVIIGSALLVRSFLTLSGRDPGIVSTDLLSFNVQFVALTRSSGDPAATARAAEQVLERVAALPGVTAAGGATGLPTVTAQRGTRFELEGRQLTPDESGALFIAVTPDYFRTTQTPIRAGRAIERTDRAESPAVALISETMATLLFPGQDPIGKRLRLVNPEQSNEWRTIVGVVGDIRFQGLDDEPVPTIYTAFAQTPFMWLYFMVRPASGPIAASIRPAVPSVHPSLTAGNLRTMHEIVAGTVAEPRFRTWLVSSFAALALVLAAVGIYGTIAYSVAQRTHEIGIRMALGAGMNDVLGLVVREGVLMAGMGAIIGLGAAAAMTGLMSSLLVGVTPRDPLAFGAAAAILLLVAALASFLPARRAARIEPLEALRTE
jgi:putative ABC transport system permease protein